MKFRSLKEVQRFLFEQQRTFNLDSQILDKQITRLKAQLVKATEFEILDVSGTPGKHRNKVINTDFPTVKVPKFKDLEKNYVLSEKLTNQYNALTDAENQVKLSFRNATNEGVIKLLSDFTKLKSQIEQKLRELFIELNRVAEGHAPAEYKNFIKKLSTELNENQHIECDSISTFTYGAVKAGNLVFAGYIVLANAISDVGETIPNLYVCVSWEVGGVVSVFVEHEFVPPAMLQGGTVVDDTKKAVKAITTQLALEGFSSQIGNLPVSMTLKLDKLTNDLFSAAELLKSVEVKHEQLVFHFKTSTTNTQIESVRLQLFLEVKSMLRKKRSTSMRMRTDGKSVVFTFSGLEEQGITSQDLEWLADRYKLNHTQLRKIANEINNG